MKINLQNKKNLTSITLEKIIYVSTKYPLGLQKLILK